MQNIVCLECSAEIPDNSECCPECGFPSDSMSIQECPACKNSADFSANRCAACGFSPEDQEPDGDIGADNAGMDEGDLIGGQAEGLLNSNSARTQDQPEDSQAVADASATAQEATLQDTGEQNMLNSDPVVSAIRQYIAEAKADIINNPVKAFYLILTELDKSNKEIQKTVAQQNGITVAEFRESAQNTIKELSRLTAEQNEEVLNKSKEMTLTIVSEITAAATKLKESSSAATAELSGSIKQIATKPTGGTVEGPVEQNDKTDYILYICCAMLAFTIFNLFITVYAVKLLK